MAILLSLILGVLIIFYFFMTRNYKYWQKRGIPCADKIVPGAGHMWMLSTKTISELYCKIYNDNKKHSMIGIYNFTLPSLMILEPDLVKTVLQSNFASFHKNGAELDPKLDPIMANNPFFSYGEKWLTSRKRLTYAFSNVRLKILLESIKTVCVKFENFLDNKHVNGNVGEMELKNLFSRFTAQVVASAIFGVDGFCFDDENEHKSFLNIFKDIMEPSIQNRIMMSSIFLVPWLNKLLKCSLLPKHIDQFFRTLVTELIEQRRTDGTPKTDFLHLIVELEQKENDKFDVEAFTTYTLAFVIDGYESNSIVLSFVSFHLATHPEVQDRLRNEVLSVLNQYDGKITYEALKDMTYMDQVLNESQRLIPAGGFMIKKCTEEFELKGSDGLICRVEPGIEVLISIEGLHNDPRYWENPDVFDPDRFSPDRKHNIQKFTFLPFGEGPRMCVGMKIALLQIKACLTMLLRKYKFELSPKTKLPLKRVVGTILPIIEGGLWLNFQKI